VSGEAAPGKPRVVLVTDGEQRAALAAVRSLGAAGFSVVVASSRAPSIAGVSRHTRHFHLVPSPLLHPQDFVGGIEGIVRTRGVDVLLPMADASLIAVLGAPERFPGVSIPFVSLEQFQRISNKAALLETARELGIAVPEQWVIPSAASADKFDASCVRFPVILKPARSVVDAADCRVKLGVSHASTAAQLSTRLREYPVEAFPILLQQRIVGPGIGIFLLVWDGQTVAVFGHRRLREAPPSGGVSVYRESVVPSDALVASSRALLDKFSWHGVAMVEYKVDAATGTPYLMEVNGRFWGSLQLAIDAGIDFPALLVKKALGDGLIPARVPQAGVRSRWEFGDINHLLARLRKSADELSLPPGSASLGRAVLDFFSWHRGDRLEVFRFSDPAPFFREAIEWIKRR
jgi:predicted ATP-grasp superfamily ATP-dependent carboligase